MGSILIIGGDLESRKLALRSYLSKLRVLPHEVRILPSSIGIDVIRATQRWLNQRPDGESKALVIEEASTLTSEAQASLLKTLEEPPSYAAIFLLTAEISSLLATVVSRCRIVVSHSLPQSSISAANNYQRLRRLPLVERLVVAEEIGSDRETALAFTLANLQAAQRQLHEAVKEPSATTELEIANLRLLLRLYSDLQANVNVRLAVDTCLLELH